MDAFLYACAKIIVFNKRAQQNEKYKERNCSFQNILERIDPFLFVSDGCNRENASLKKFRFVIQNSSTCLSGSFTY
jgi:hypothetical protein